MNLKGHKKCEVVVTEFQLANQCLNLGLALGNLYVSLSLDHEGWKIKVECNPMGNKYKNILEKEVSKRKRKRKEHTKCGEGELEDTKKM